MSSRSASGYTTKQWGRSYISYDYKNEWHDKSFSPQIFRDLLRREQAARHVQRIPTQETEQEFGKFKTLYNNVLVCTTPDTVVDKKHMILRFQIKFYNYLNERYYLVRLTTSADAVWALLGAVTSPHATGFENENQSYFPNWGPAAFNEIPTNPNESDMIAAEYDSWEEPILCWTCLTTHQDKVEDIRKAIQKMMSSPSLLSQAWFYKGFAITHNSKEYEFPLILKEYLFGVWSKVSNNEWTRITRNLMDPKCNNYLYGDVPSQLRELRARNDTYTGMAVLSRSVDIPDNSIDRIAVSVTSPRHWVAKFTGAGCQLTIGFTNAPPKSNAGYELDILIQSNIAGASAIHIRRIFWHWDYAQNFGHCKNFMTFRHDMLAAFEVKITSSMIASFIQTYLSDPKHRRYDVLNFNCQHFIIALMAGISPKRAKKLSVHQCSSSALTAPSTYEWIDALHKQMRRNWRRESQLAAATQDADDTKAEVIIEAPSFVSDQTTIGDIPMRKPEISTPRDNPRQKLKAERLAAIRSWLDEMNCEEYWKDLKKEGFDSWKSLQLLDAEMLDVIGVTKIGHRKLLLHQVKKLTDNGP